MLRMEFTRILTRPIFWLVLLLGTILAVYSALIFWPSNVTDNYYLMYPRNPYISWFLIGDMPTSNIYTVLFPLLASMAFADSYAEDYNSGYIKNILTRVARKKYIFVRYVSNFCIGGLVAIFPLIINFLVNSLAFPLIENNYYYGMNLIQEHDIFPGLFYEHPLFYVVVRLLLLFLVGGILASIGLSLSMVVKNRYIVLIFPFLIFMSIDVLMQDYSISSVFLLFGSWNVALPLYLFIGIIGTMGWIWFQGVKNEKI